MSFSKLFSRFLRTFQCCSEISLLFNFQRPNKSAIANSAVLYLAFLRSQVDSLPIIQQSSRNVNSFLKLFLFFWNFFIMLAFFVPIHSVFCLHYTNNSHYIYIIGRLPTIRKIWDKATFIWSPAICAFYREDHINRLFSGLPVYLWP